MSANNFLTQAVSALSNSNVVVPKERKESASGFEAMLRKAEKQPHRDEPVDLKPIEDSEPQDFGVSDQDGLNEAKEVAKFDSAAEKPIIVQQEKPEIDFDAFDVSQEPVVDETLESEPQEKLGQIATVVSEKTPRANPEITTSPFCEKKPVEAIVVGHEAQAEQKTQETGDASFDVELENDDIKDNIEKKDDNNITFAAHPETKHFETRGVQVHLGSEEKILLDITGDQRPDLSQEVLEILPDQSNLDHQSFVLPENKAQDHQVAAQPNKAQKQRAESTKLPIDSVDTRENVSEIRASAKDLNSDTKDAGFRLNDSNLELEAFGDEAPKIFTVGDKIIRFDPLSNTAEFVAADLNPLEQIGTTIAHMKSINKSQVVLKLHPEEMGKISVRITFAPDQKTIQKINISAENNNTLVDLKLAAEQLRLSLSQVMDTQKTELNFDLRHETSGQGFFDQQGAGGQQNLQRANARAQDSAAVYAQQDEQQYISSDGVSIRV